MKDTGELRDDIRLPDGDLGADIKNKFENNEDLLVSIFIINTCIVKYLQFHVNQEFKGPLPFMENCK